MGGLSKEGKHPSTGPPTYQIIKVTNANHMSMMKTSLTTIPMCPQERFALYKSSSRLVLCYKKDWSTLLHLSYFIYLLFATIYLITKLSITYNFSACRENLTENRLSLPSSPRWVRHSYLSEGLRLIPYTCGSSILFSGAVAGECSAFGEWNLVRKHLYSVLKFSVTCHYGN